jgi:predicted kinase
MQTVRTPQCNWTHISYSHPMAASDSEQPTLFLPVGFPACGKTTAASHLKNTLIYEQGNGPHARDEMYDKVSDAMKVHPRYNVYIDRCNHNIPQRRLWLQLAKERGYKVVIIQFMMLPAACRERAFARFRRGESHATILKESDIVSAFATFEKEYKGPELAEATGLGLNARIVRVRRDSGEGSFVELLKGECK